MTAYLDKDAPTGLPRRIVKERMESEDTADGVLDELVHERATKLHDIRKTHGTLVAAPEDVRKEYESISNAVKTRVRKIRASMFTEYREEYFKRMDKERLQKELHAETELTTTLPDEIPRICLPLDYRFELRSTIAKIVTGKSGDTLQCVVPLVELCVRLPPVCASIPTRGAKSAKRKLSDDEGNDTGEVFIVTVESAYTNRVQDKPPSKLLKTYSCETDGCTKVSDFLL